MTHIKQIKVRPSIKQSNQIKKFMEQINEATASKALVNAVDRYLDLVTRHEKLKSENVTMYNDLQNLSDLGIEAERHRDLLNDSMHHLGLGLENLNTKYPGP